MQVITHKCSIEFGHAEVYVNGMHTDLDSPPNSSMHMFKRAGSNTPSVRKKHLESTSPEMAQALAEAASQVSAIVRGITLHSTTASTSTGASPAKQIQNRSKCYKQLVDLKSLWSQGLITDEDYAQEKDAIRGLLKNCAHTYYKKLNRH